VDVVDSADGVAAPERQLGRLLDLDAVDERGIAGGGRPRDPGETANNIG
jgi:hypothetical protein